MRFWTTSPANVRSKPMFAMSCVPVMSRIRLALTCTATMRPSRSATPQAAALAAHVTTRFTGHFLLTSVIVASEPPVAPATPLVKSGEQLPVGRSPKQQVPPPRAPARAADRRRVARPPPPPPLRRSAPRVASTAACIDANTPSLAYGGTWAPETRCCSEAFSLPCAARAVHCWYAAVMC